MIGGTFGSGGTTINERRREPRLNRWFRETRCKACGTHYSRKKPNCPVCKTRKGGRGQPLPMTGGFVHRDG